MLRDSRGFFEALVGDGRPLIHVGGLCLALAGGFCTFQAATGHFLPHDVAFLRMTPEDLCKINECRIVHFMIHDRISFGGALLGIATLYLWLAEFPLKAGEAWAWWALLFSGVVGFGGFLTYLGYGYLDTWHGVATLLLLPCFALGLWRSRLIVRHAAPAGERSWRSLLARGGWPGWGSREGMGRLCLLAASVGGIGAGFTIQLIGMTAVFVPSDLVFMGLTRADLDAINARLVPLIAHDRAGFGGAVATLGILITAALWCAAPSRALWQALLVAGLAAWTTAIAVHPAIGYVDALHLAPAVTGASLYFLGLALTAPAMLRGASLPNVRPAGLA